MMARWLNSAAQPHGAEKSAADHHQIVPRTLQCALKSENRREKNRDVAGLNLLDCPDVEVGEFRQPFLRQIPLHPHAADVGTKGHSIGIISVFRYAPLGRNFGLTNTAQRGVKCFSDYVPSASRIHHIALPHHRAFVFPDNQPTTAEKGLLAMSFKFECPHCGQRVSAEVSDSGVTAPCPHCSRAITISNPLSAVLPSPNHPLWKRKFGNPFKPIKDRDDALCIVTSIIALCCIATVASLVAALLTDPKFLNIALLSGGCAVFLGWKKSHTAAKILFGVSVFSAMMCALAGSFVPASFMFLLSFVFFRAVQATYRLHGIYASGACLNHGERSSSPADHPSVPVRPPPVFGWLSIVLPAFAILVSVISASDAAAHASGFSLFPGWGDLFAGIATAGILFLIFGVAALARKERKRWLVGLSPALLIVLSIFACFLLDLAAERRHQNPSVSQQATNSAPVATPTKPIPALTETQQALIAGRQFRHPPIDGNLFLIRKLETLYDRLSLLSGNPQVEAQLTALWKDANDAIQYTKSSKLDAEVGALYADFLSQRNAFIALQSEIGAIDAQVAAKLSDSRMKNSVESGWTAGTLWAQSENNGSDTGDALLGGVLVGLAQFFINDYQHSQEVEQKKKAQHAASFQRYDARRLPLEANRKSLISVLTRRHGWRKGETGFDDSAEELAREREAWRQRDFVLLERLALDRMRVRPRDPFAVLGYLGVISETNIQQITEAQWLALAELAFKAALLIPADSPFGSDRASLLTQAAWAADNAMELQDDGFVAGVPNDVSGLSLAYSEQVLQNEPKDVGGIGRFYKAKALAHRGEFSKAAEIIAEVVSIQQRHAFINFTAARIQSRGGLQREAFASVQRALAAGWTNIKALRTWTDFAQLRNSHAVDLNELLKLKFEWSIIPGVFTDDVVLTNKSAFTLTNITFRVDLKTGNRDACRMLEKLPRLEAGKSYRWDGIMSDSAKADLKMGTLTTDQD